MAIKGPKTEIGPDGTIILCALTCPECGHKEELEMPPYSYQQYHTCSGCGVRLHATGDACCVFCAYGDVPCPPTQISGKSCCSPD